MFNHFKRLRIRCINDFYVSAVRHVTGIITAYGIHTVNATKIVGNTKWEQLVVLATNRVSS